MNLIQMSIGGGALILFTVLVRSVALDKLPKKTFFVLWCVSVLRLLLPISIPSPFSVFTQAERVLYSQPEVPVMEFMQILMPADGQAPVLQTTSAASVPLLTILWLSGASLLASYFAIVYINSLRKFRTSLPEETPFAQDWLAQHQRGLRSVQVRQSDRVVSPLTYGILRPVILLPKNMDRSNESVLYCVLTHEHIHIRRFDAVTKLILAVALCVHWFNPLAWIMYCLANRDLELICDEQVLQELGSKGRKPYALALLEMEENKQRGFALFSHFGKLAMEERIAAIVNYKKRSVFAVFLAVLLVSGATTAFATGPANEDGSQAAPTNHNEPFPEAILLKSEDGVVMYSDYMGFEEFMQTGLAEQIGFQPETGDKVLASAVYYPNGLGDDAPAGFPASMCCLTVDFYETETFGHLWRGVYMAEFTTIDPDEFAQGWMDFLLNCAVVDRDIALTKTPSIHDPIPMITT